MIISDICECEYVNVNIWICEYVTTRESFFVDFLGKYPYKVWSRSC